MHVEMDKAIFVIALLKSQERRSEREGEKVRVFFSYDENLRLVSISFIEKNNYIYFCLVLALPY